MATFLLIHGAWSAAWAWKKLRAPMRDRGHELFTPTHTGLGERAHLARPEIDLEAHIADVLAVIEFEDLHDLVVVGHSYGGMVATGVVDRVHERVRRLVYLDAFVPRDGQSVFDLLGEPTHQQAIALARQGGDGWRVPPNPMPPDTPEADKAWAMPRRRMQPLRTLEQRLPLTGAVDRVRRSYIYCTRVAPGDPFRPFAQRAQAEGWDYRALDASHNPQITMPETLADVFDEIAR
ncbi:MULTISPECIES: alpha/beta fold hydrolase [unclassified Variovorax]|uniref:alpha/beta fold hydrolase n=1 Tax=unclassified Variovorax TaxID=663243 RepID=UPI0013160BF2|nr:MULTISPECIES: alpha/beta fold hydrolase [unclassified Variovorax]VTU13821.1 haloalkane dehalogenase [Variovorax sp. SRS16]VTU19270.1 haloalkane dehalogenase [Variovorax sp. PBL-E5]